VDNQKRELFEFSVSYELTYSVDGRITWESGTAEVVAADENDILLLFKEDYPGCDVELTSIIKGESLGFEEGDECS
jgi:hypothetical protein